MTSDQAVVVAVATYNEIDNLPPLMDSIQAAVPQAHVLVVDDNSPDGTGTWCTERSKTDARVTCVVRAERGLGTATIAALQWAIDQRYEYVVQMDADFSHPPDRIQDLLAAANESMRPDVVVASRYARGGAIRGWPVHRQLMSRTLNGFARRWLRLPVRDCSGSFRCYRVAKLAELDFTEMRSTGYSFFEEILWQLARAGAVFVEVPYEFVDRKHGQTKLRFPQMVRAAWRIVSLGLRWRSIR